MSEDPLTWAESGEIVIADHYAILGVRPASSRAAIRAAYLQLMRCYHPDRNSSVSAAAKVREITAAYAVLGDPKLRAQYEAEQSLLRRARPEPSAFSRPARPLPSWFGLAAGCVVVLLFVPLLLPPVTPRQESERIKSVDVRPRAIAPEQLAVAAGTAIGNPIGYTLHRSDEDAASAISVKDGDQLAGFLAAVGRTTTQAARAVVPAAANKEPRLGSPIIQELPVSAPVNARPVKSKRPVELAEPSFSCSSAKTWATNSVCNSAKLASLDRQLAGLWGDSMARAGDSERARLLKSDGKFIARRDACSSEPCVRAAYTAQISEIQNMLIVQRPR